MSNLEALTLSDAPLPRVVVNASVIFNILNGYFRRTAVESRVVGTLLGEVRDNVISVSECFIVPFTENMEESVVTLNTDYHKNMYKYHRRNNAKEVVVGWFATSTPSGALITLTSSLVHEFYSKECGSSIKSPIHLVVDTSLLHDTMQVRGFLGKENMIGNESFCNSYQECKVDIDITESEASILHAMIHGQRQGREYQYSVLTAEMKSSSNSGNTSSKVAVAIQDLVSLLDKLQAYVDAVVDGKVAQPNREVGMLITEALHALTSAQSAQQMQALQTRYDDLLMVSYLASLTQTQTLISEKLNQIL